MLQKKYVKFLSDGDFEILGNDKNRAYALVMTKKYKIN